MVDNFPWQTHTPAALASSSCLSCSKPGKELIVLSRELVACSVAVGGHLPACLDQLLDIY